MLGPSSSLRSDIIALVLFYTPDEGRQDVEAMKPECKCMQDEMVLDKSGNECWQCQVERI
jgi:hypothetical protein